MSYNTPSYNSQTIATVTNPSAIAVQDGSQNAVIADRHQLQLFREVGGRYSSQALRVSGGNIFMAATAVAGVTVPALATTLASTAGIINPAGSGVNVELIAIGIASTTIQVAVKAMALGFHLYGVTGEGAPTGVTALTSYKLPLGKGSGGSQAAAHTVATLTNAAALAPLYWPFPTLMTAVGTQMALAYFNGEVVFGPSVAMVVANSTSALAGQQITYVWAEWPA